METQGLNLELSVEEKKEKSVREEAGKEGWYARELNAVGVTAQGESQLCMCV